MVPDIIDALNDVKIFCEMLAWMIVVSGAFTDPLVQISDFKVNMLADSINIIILGILCFPNLSRLSILFLLCTTFLFAYCFRLKLFEERNNLLIFFFIWVKFA